MINFGSKATVGLESAVFRYAKILLLTQMRQMLRYKKQQSILVLSMIR